MSDFFRECETISSIEDLLDKVNSLLAGYSIDSAYLRGQADYAWGLRPTISRRLPYAGFETQGYDKDRENNLLHRFRRYARAFLERDVDERELVFLARHHGIPVRLLDWTSNPLVALYYACVDDGKLNKDGSVWVFLRRKHPKREDYYDIYDSNWPPPLEVKGVKIIYAPYVSPRIPAQSGHFTTQADPDKEIETYDPSNYEVKDFDVEKIEKWKIPSGKKTDFILQLERCGINERALFPDLDGIARSIVRTEVLRTGLSIAL